MQLGQHACSAHVSYYYLGMVQPGLGYSEREKLPAVLPVGLLLSPTGPGAASGSTSCSSRALAAAPDGARFTPCHWTSQAHTPPAVDKFGDTHLLEMCGCRSHAGPSCAAIAPWPCALVSWWAHRKQRFDSPPCKHHALGRCTSQASEQAAARHWASCHLAVASLLLAAAASGSTGKHGTDVSGRSTLAGVCSVGAPSPKQCWLLQSHHVYKATMLTVGAPSCPWCQCVWPQPERHGHHKPCACRQAWTGSVFERQDLDRKAAALEQEAALWQLMLQVHAETSKDWPGGGRQGKACSQVHRQVGSCDMSICRRQAGQTFRASLAPLLCRWPTALARTPS